ncbi:MAG: transglutaminase family protein, partial [Myxococcales bacterium]|nr:transglutaminase family protein [Myxococcales bacterium]
MRLLVQHRSHYAYPRPAALGPHLIRLRPANHVRARIDSYRLAIDGEHRLHWLQDPHGNHLARVTFPVGDRRTAFDVLVELTVDIKPVNPFDFLVDPRAREVPFAYPDGLAVELAPFLDTADPAYALGPTARAFLADLPADGEVVALLTALNQRVNQRVRYVIREEAGVWTPEQTLGHGRGSCRDSAVLLVAALRSRGLAARFVSGYLIQLTDEGMIPDEPRGLGHDVVDLHAWAEVYLPGAGWIGLDATSGLMCGEGHIPLACTASPALAAPIEGTSDTLAEQVEFGTTIVRLGHEPRPTAPYPDDTWLALLDAGDRADAALHAEGLTVTVGGEPTFTSRDEVAAPEWNTAALGPTKWRRGWRLT